MSIITPFSTPGPTSSDPANFDARADNFVGVEWPRFISEANLLEANLGAAAAPGGNMVPYAFASSTTVGDPGAGKLRLNNATQASATVICADLVDAIGVAATERLDDMGTGTSTVKGKLRLSKVGDPTKFLLFDVTGVTTPGGGGYRQIAVSGGLPAGASPFADTDALTISFSRSGDQGPVGPFATWTALTPTTISGSPTTVTFQPLDTSYGNYRFVLDNVQFSGGGLNITVSLHDGTTWSSAKTLNVGGTSVLEGEILLLGYRRDQGVVRAVLTDATAISPGLTPSANAPANLGIPYRVTGGVKGVRFGLDAAGTFSSGVIRPEAS